MKRTRPMPLGVAILLLAIGLMLGSVFTFGMSYWNAPISREDAIPVTATLAAYHEPTLHDPPHRKDEVSFTLSFTDYPQRLYIDSRYGKAVMDAVKAIPAGTELTMLVHPNSDTILELKHERGTILSFAEAQKDLAGENTGFLYLGGFCYFLALCGGYGLVSHLLRKKKKNEGGNACLK